MVGPKCLSLWWLLPILLIFANRMDSAPANKTIRIGYFVGWIRNGDYAGAINVAIENAQKDGLVRDYNVRYNYCTRSIRFNQF